VLSVFAFGTPPFRRLREQIWLEVVDEAVGSSLPGLIFTFAPERTVSPDFIARLTGRLDAAGCETVLVELRCDERTIERRLDAPSRARFNKLRSVAAWRALRDGGAFDYPMPAPHLTIDTAAAAADEAAQRIADALRD